MTRLEEDNLHFIFRRQNFHVNILFKNLMSLQSGRTRYFLI